MDSNFKLGCEYILDLRPQNVDIYNRAYTGIVDSQLYLAGWA